MSIRITPWLAAMGTIGATLIALTYHGNLHQERLAESAALLLLLLTAYAIAAYKVRWQLPLGGPVIYFALFTAWATLSQIWSIAPSVSTLTSTWFITGFAGCLLGMVFDETQRQRFSSLLVLLGLYLAGLTVYQGFVLGVPRPTGLMSNWNNHAAFLNLILLPVAARYLATNASWHRYTWGAIAAALSFAISLTLSRGALGGLALGLLVLLWAYGPVRNSKGRAISLLLVIAGAVIIGNLTFTGQIGGRFDLTALSNPDAFSSGRLDIWLASWKQYLHHPWLGSGIGTFYVDYPLFQPRLDGSAGQHAHNDLLEFLVELGPVGLLIAVAIFVSLCRTGTRLLRTQLAPSERLEISGLIAACVAVFSHTLFTFNLYHVPILIVVGLYCGLLTRRAITFGVLPYATSRPASRFSPFGFMVLLIALAAFPMQWLLSLYMSEQSLIQAASDKDTTHAIEALNRAARYAPFRDEPYVMRAQRIFLFLKANPNLDKASRIGLVRYGLMGLTEASKRYPTRPETFLARARLMQFAPHSYNRSEVSTAFEKALHYKPRYLRARLSFAHYLRSHGNSDQADNILEAGWGMDYYNDYRVILLYLQQLANSREDHDDKAGADAARSVARRIKAQAEQHNILISTFRVASIKRNHLTVQDKKG